MEAGCRKKIWEMKDEIPVQFHWDSQGQLLAQGVCIDDDYEKYLPPSDGSKKVYSTIETHRVRDVDAKKKTLSIDFILTMRWLDSRIKANFTKYDNKSGEVILGPAAVEKIWSPGVYVFNRQSFKVKEEWASLITARILTTKEINHLRRPRSTRRLRVDHGHGCHRVASRSGACFLR